MPKLPANTKVDIHVKYCTGLRSLKTSDFNTTKEQRDDAIEKYDKAYRALCLACTEIEAEVPNDQTPVPDARTENERISTLQNCLDELRVARSHVLTIPAEEDEDALPNPFLAITIEHDELIPENAYTDVLREEDHPFWDQNIETMAIADLARRSTAFTDEDSLEPTALVFSVYHDNAVCEGTGAPKNEEDEKWRRESPQTDVLLASAKWNFVDIMKHVNRQKKVITLKLQHIPRNTDEAPPEICFHALVTVDPKCFIQRWGTNWRKKTDADVENQKKDEKLTQLLKHEDKIKIIAENESPEAVVAEIKASL